MRIALVTETYPPDVNGAAAALRRWAIGLAQRGHEVQVVRPSRGRDDGPRSEPGLKPYSEEVVPGAPLPCYRDLRFGLPCKRRLARLWSDPSLRPDIVHVATEGPLGWSALSAARRLEIPLSSSFHTNFQRYGRHYGLGPIVRLGFAYMRLVHNRSLCTMAPTQSSREELHAQGFRNLVVVGRGVDATLFDPAKRSDALRASWGASPDTPVVLCVSRLAPEKNHTLVFEAFEAMRRVRPDAKLVLVGDGPLRRKLGAAHAGEHVIFAGLRRGEDLASHYASADIFLFASTTEAFGNVTVEAMASGLPVVAYNYMSAREHIRPGQSGVLVPFDQPVMFVTAARGLIAQPRAVWQSMGAAGRQAALSITWDQIIDQFDHTLRRIAASHEPIADWKPATAGA